MTLKRTALFDQHLKLGAKLVGFGGWEMPLQYAGILAEHRAVRSQVGMFDVSHMSKWLVQVPDLEQLQKLVPSNLARLKVGQAQYSVLLNPNGGVIDDLILYYLGDQSWLIISNAATRSQVEPWLQAHLPNCISDRYAEYALIAVQGAEAIARLQEMCSLDPDQVPRFHHQFLEILAQPAWLARTGYTGEDGVEIMVPPQIAGQLWQNLLALEITPCGLGARDTLRLEAGLHLYGQELSADISPLVADLGWLIHWAEKGDFIGRTALEAQQADGILQKLVAFTLEGKNIARPGYGIYAEGQQVGMVTSGTLSPSLGVAIGLGYVPISLAQPGQILTIQIRDRFANATIVRRPHYRKKS
ncbi:MAG: glycine cleavage system aminomethyltransferase GcvT [Pseudanabaenaceae cyanobacterium bins.68]|nr:glycine cleavage system aminomethyltransferase GcvT [Pseudanabaenaceae cyanobacterium bins.68]